MRPDEPKDDEPDVRPTATRPILLCFDGSEDAVSAIASAGRTLASSVAVVLTVWEHAADWLPYDPATIITAPISRIASHALGLDEIAREFAQQTAERGVELARIAGFKAEARVVEGKTWRSICDVAEELDADPIVVGARGLSRVQSALLGACPLPWLCMPTDQCRPSTPIGIARGCHAASMASQLGAAIHFGVAVPLVRNQQMAIGLLRSEAVVS